MNCSKFLFALLALGANAKITTTAIAGITGGFLKNKMETGDKLFDATNPGVVSGPWVAKDKVFALKDDTKFVYPGSAFVGGNVLFSMGSVSAGFGVIGGYRKFFNLPTDGQYGIVATTTPAATTTATTPAAQAGFAVKYPAGQLFAVPQVIVSADVMGLNAQLSVGLDVSYSEFAFNQIVNHASAREAALNNLLFGVKVGLEGIYSVGPCVGVGVGVSFTYWPSSMNKVNQKDKIKAINAAADDKAALVNIGGTYAVMLSLSGHFAI